MKNTLYRSSRLLVIVSLLVMQWVASSQNAVCAQSTKNVSVTGVVTGDQSEAMPGVTVVIKGTTKGTSTDAEGRYSLGDVPEQSTLVFSFVGYATEEVLLNGRSVVNVKLVPDLQSLGEVVVIGYGEREKKDLTGAIGSVSAAQISKTPVVSPDQALQGRISGVNVTAANGDPSAKQVIRIRGIGTLGNNDPLIVVDGMPLAEPGINAGVASNLRPPQNPLSLINPADIESIDVLKDASATAIYGMRASNGVILITTKKGKAGRTSINFSAYRGVQQLRKRFDMLDTPGYLTLLNESFTNFNQNLAQQEQVYNPSNPQNILRNNSDWQSPVINDNAAIEDYNLSLTGGSEKYNLFISGGYFRQQSVIKSRQLERYSFAINSNVRPLKFLNIGQTLRTSYSRQDLTGVANLDMAYNPPVQAIYDPNGTNGFASSLQNLYGFGYRRNMLGVKSTILDNRLNSLRAIGSFYAEITPVQGLTVRGNIGLDYDLSTQPNFRLNDSNFQPGAGVSGNNLGTGINRTGFNILREVTATYARNFSGHNLSFLLGFTDQVYNFESINFTASDFPGTSRELRSYGLTAAQGVENNRWAWGLQGYIGRVGYNYNSKYYLDLTLRRDGSSRFSPENRWDWFPAVAAAWRFTGEKFAQNLPFLSEGKLRVGWGQSGNQDVEPYRYIATINLNPQYYFGGTRVSGAAPGFFTNNLFWETSIQTNIGLDLGFFQNKLTLTADYFIKDTRDILIGVPLPAVSGFSGTVLNAVSVKNAGIELALGYNGNAGAFKYGVSANMTALRNQVTGLGERGQPITTANNRTEIGRPVGYFYGYQTNGIFQNQAEVDAYRAVINDRIAASGAVAPGDIRFVDNNGPRTQDTPAGQFFSGQPDGVVDANDRTYIGKPIPDLYYGLTLTAGYKDFDLSMFFQGVQGVDLFNAPRASGEQMSAGNNQWRSTNNRWTGEGTSNTMPRAVRNDPHGNNRFSNRWIEDGSFLRGKNFQIGYTLPAPLLKKMGGMSSLRVYASAQNLFVLTRYTGLDPEFSGDNVLSNGADNSGITPLPRMFIVGLNLGF